MGEIYLDSSKDIDAYLIRKKAVATGCIVQTVRNGRKYTQVSLAIPIEPFIRAMKIIAALMITVATAAFALISVRFRKFWGELATGKKEVLLLAPVTPKKDNKTEGEGGLEKKSLNFGNPNFDELLGSLNELKNSESEEQGSLKDLYANAKNLVMSDDASLDALTQGVTDFVEGYLLDSDDSPEKEQLIKNWDKLENPISQKDLKKVFYEAARVYKDYKVSDGEKLHGKLTQSIPLDEASQKATQPKTAHDKGSEDSTVAGFKVGVRTARGKRDTMEDRDVSGVLDVDGNKIPYFGVFDGHSGIKCSQYLKANLVDYITDKLSGKDLSDKTEVDDALKLAFVTVNSDFKKVEGNDDGSTAIMALIINNTIWVANTGDSRAVLSLGGKAVQLSRDAKPTGKFKDGVINRGGKVSPKNLVSGMLAVARAFGDKYCTGITARPINHTFCLSNRVQATNHLIIACDGLWDVIGSGEAAEMVANKTASEAAEFLLNEAFNRGTGDNVSVMVIDLLP